ncbi:MAG: hypothetical protein CMJ81_02985 [Planctomycetaceae bacterium]|nr:hypothetical protein [Planctomycetaceae bacterium]
MHPELVEAHVTDLDMILEISKFRSGAGHDFSYFRDSLPAAAMTAIAGIDNFFATDTSEPESSMKHYFAPHEPYKQENGDNSTIPVYAPFTGSITRVIEESREEDISIVNKRVEITATADTDYTTVLFHLNLDDAYPQIFNDYPTIDGIWTHQEDDPVYTTRAIEAGDLLGYADMRSSHDFDVAVLFNDATDDKWISLFELIPDSLFSDYEARGLARADTSISKAYRLANPVTWGERNENDWVRFTTVPEPGPLPLLLTALCWLWHGQRSRETPRSL